MVEYMNTLTDHEAEERFTCRICRVCILSNTSQIEDIYQRFKNVHFSVEKKLRYLTTQNHHLYSSSLCPQKSSSADPDSHTLCVHQVSYP